MVVLRRVIRAVLAVGMAFVVVTATPAVAAQAYGSSTVGSSKITSNSDSVYDWCGDVSHVLRVIETFSQHEKNSVKLKKLKLCYSGPEGQPEWLVPSIYVNGKFSKELERRETASSGCRTWTINREFTAKPGKELFYVATKLGYTQAIMLNQFKR